MEELRQFLPIPHRLACSDAYTCLVSEDGKLSTWGYNESTPNGESERSMLPKLIDLADPVSYVACSDTITGVITYDGRLSTWGGITANLSLPQAITMVSVGDFHMLVLTVDGGGESGVLGTGDLSNRDTLTLVKLPLPCLVVKCDFSTSYAIMIDGSLYHWGDVYDFVGTGVQTTSLLPAEVDLSEPVLDISCGTCYVTVLTVEGEVYVYGDNEIHTGRTGRLKLPSRCKAISSSSWHNLALLENGELWGWSYSGMYWVLGIGEDTVDPSIPILIPLDCSVSVMGLGITHSVILSREGVMYGCGYGCLGNGKKHCGRFTRGV